MKNIIFLVLFADYVIFGSMAEDDNLSQIDEEMIMVIADKIISERMEVLENKMTREFDAKLKIVMEEQYDNTETIKVLEETIVKQNNEIAKLQNMEETLNLQRQEITALNEIVNEMKLKWKNDRKDTILVNEQYYGHKYPVLINDGPHNSRNTSEVNQRQSSHRPVTTFEQKWMHTRIRIKRTHVMDTKDTNRFDRRPEVPSNRVTRLLKEEESSTVAFYAYMSKDEVSIGPHHTLIFDHIETNIGNGYNGHTGVFIAPLNGVYMFFYTIFGYHPSYMSIEITVNSVARGVIYFNNQAAPSAYTGCTGVAVFALNKGDDCFIRTHSTYIPSGSIRSDNLMRTSFSGVKIG